MSMADWRMQGVEFATCNCNWGCPCQFSALPSHGNCEAVVSMRIDRGHYKDIQLDGLCWVGTFAWPKAIHEGDGRCQLFIDERASAEQREALLRILAGEDTEPGATVFSVFASTLGELYEPQFVPIEFSVDVDRREAHTRIPGVLEVTGEPIRNPVSGQAQEARLVLPNGFEFTEAQMASGSYQTHGAIKIQSQQGHGHFARLHFTGQGVVR
ncbi:DUF1326 domain-containing protein [Pseudomonas sp. LPB0260]|uniref:DUF1326 domain-containing protein n=1 Tax=Pseudomonas sp. LPB0260 TaxID=2614442 RepID=UPI0015C22CE5|nr:DUF1326 domain-containing protein [Pseudomonas sp. LPB0260]QLC74213.1 DUF1326 domain-containing protein [Pseudomonas sp. LPB0260]QLC76983.1 DUF1326 domain-containing protein [Pseudomonas sp. LPB0260]